jgi:outer membrane protein TolC
MDNRPRQRRPIPVMSRTMRWQRRPAVPGLLGPILLGLMCAHSSTAQQNTSVRLTLDEAIQLALKQNRSVHLRSLAVDDMRSRKDEARSYYMPQMKSSGSVLHITELAGVEVPRGAFGDFPATGPVPSKALVIDQGSDTGYTGGVSLDQPLTQLFGIHQKNVAAGQDVLIARTQLDLTEDDVALQTRQLYYNILINQQELEASQQQLAAAEVKDSEAQSDVERGNALEVTVLQSKATILETRQKSLTLKLQGEDLQRQLADLLGLPVDTQLSLDPAVSDRTIDIPARAEAVRVAMNNNQDIKVARQTLEKAKAQLAAARDQYIPDITALSEYNYQSGIPFLVHNFGTFGFHLSYDLFDGGRREAEVRDAKAGLASAQVTVDKLESDVTVQVEAAYDRLEEAKALLDVADQAVTMRTEAARLADRQLEQSAALNSAQSQAHADLSNAMASLLEAKLNVSLAEADVKRTIGQMPQ